MHKETNLIKDNKRAEIHSFLYYLHEEGKFDCSALSAFCQYLAKIEAISLAQLKDLHFIQEQILKHLVWHFDSQDLYIISDLPSDYGEYLDSIECEINELFGRLE